MGNHNNDTSRMLDRAREGRINEQSIIGYDEGCMRLGSELDQAAVPTQANRPTGEVSTQDAAEDPGTRAHAGNNGSEITSDAKPHLVLLHYTAPPVVGGVEHVIGEQARLFSERGHAVMVVAGRGGAPAETDRIETVVIPALDSESDRNRTVRQALDSGMVPPDFREIQAQIEQALRPVLAGDRFVLAHNVLNYHFNLPLTAALHHLLDEGTIRHMIAWCHDVSRYVNPTSGAPLRYGFPWDLLRTWRPQLKYVAVSRQRQCVLSHVLGCPQEQIRVIPNGIDLHDFAGLGDVAAQLVEEFELLQADLVLLMPIRITRAKNIQRALDIIACLRDMGTQVRLVVTGPPDPHALDGKAYFDGLVALRHKLGLDREVCFLWEGLAGMSAPLVVGPAVVQELYRVCDLVLLTSDREGFGLPVLEAGWTDRPIFTTEVPALEEFEPSSVFSIGRGELAAQVAQRILDWADQDTSHRLRRQVRRKYGWPTIFQRHVEPLLQECGVPFRVQA
jgi:glycosyltransferase involved in cell wall biosynthesis